MESEREAGNSFETLAMLLTRIAASVESISQSIKGHQKLGCDSPRAKRKPSATSKVLSEITMLELASRFIRDHRDALTVYQSKQNHWTVDSVRGQCAGKLMQEPLVDFRYARDWSLVVCRIQFRSYARKIGVSENNLRQMLDNPSIRARRLLLIKKGPARSVYVIPLGSGFYLHNRNNEQLSKR